MLTARHADVVLVFPMRQKVGDRFHDETGWRSLCRHSGTRERDEVNPLGIQNHLPERWFPLLS